jgi:hypothetical protein
MTIHENFVPFTGAYGTAQTHYVHGWQSAVSIWRSRFRR